MNTSVDFPKAKGYPHNPKTIGEHIRKVRMDRELLQADVAAIFKVSEDCITGWENGRSEPQVRYIPRIITFLGYDPNFPNLETLGAKLKYYRRKTGLSHRRLSKLIGVDAGTISSWEQGKNIPLGKHIKALQNTIEIP